jgi:hypothetical protein
MPESVTTSLAAWRASHGFGILDIIGPEGERFLVETRSAHDPSDMSAWETMSEHQVRAYLAERGFSDMAAEETIELSRQWATTVTGSSVKISGSASAP